MKSWTDELHRRVFYPFRIFEIFEDFEEFKILSKNGGSKILNLFSFGLFKPILTLLAIIKDLFERSFVRMGLRSSVQEASGVRVAFTGLFILIL